MESKRFQLNPNAPVFIPSFQQFLYGKSGSHDATPSEQTSHADSYSRTGVIFKGTSALSDTEPLGSEEDFSNMAQEFLESRDNSISGEAIEQQTDDAFLVRSFAANFPGYSQESILDVYTANHGDMEATIDMLPQLQNFAIVDGLPVTLGIGDISTSWTPDEKKPSSSTDPGSSSGH